jgi:hypothetical protein
MMEFVSWDDDIPFSEWKVIKFMFQTTNQFMAFEITGNPWILCSHRKRGSELCSHDPIITVDGQTFHTA